MASKAEIQQEKISALINKCLANSLTEAEHQELDELIVLYPDIREVIDDMQDDEKVIEGLQERYSIDIESARSKLWTIMGYT